MSRTQPSGEVKAPVLADLDPLQRLLLPLADAFMILMLSRPSTGSLARTRVTVASTLLAAVAFFVLGLAGALAAVVGRRPLSLLAGVLLELLALGCLSLALFGVLQRLHAAPRTDMPGEPGS